MGDMACRVETNGERAAQNWRVVSFALTNLFLTTHNAYNSGALKFSPVELQICLTIAVANVQKLMRERTVPLELRVGFETHADRANRRIMSMAAAA